MANIVIKGVYTSKSALDTAELAEAANGDTFIVGSKIPYDLYTYSSSKTAFVKGDKVSNVVGDLSTPVTVDDVTEDIGLNKLYSLGFKGSDGNTYHVREAVKFMGVRKLELY